METILLILILAAALTYVVGGYFINYALVPNSGAENRELITEKNANQDVQTIDPIIEKKIKHEVKLREAWKEEMDFEAREISIESHDGLKLFGHAFEQPEKTNNWMIAVHGYQSNENETLLIGRHFYEAGYNVLTVSLRAHGKSEGKYIGMGYLDKEDLISWTHALIAKYPESRIFYHGTSMGGATVLMASGKKLPSNVKAVVSDCAFSSIWDMFSSEMKKRFNLPSFPILNMADFMGWVKAGYSIKEGNVTDFVEKSTLPILFIHTEKDDFVPVSMVHRLFNAKIQGEKDLYIVENGGHTHAKFVEPVEYYERIFSFVDQYL